MDVTNFKPETQAVMAGMASSIEASRQFNRVLAGMFAPEPPRTITTTDGVVCQEYDSVWRQTDDERIFSDDVIAMQWLSEDGMSISQLNGDEGGLEEISVADLFKELDS